MPVMNFLYPVIMHKEMHKCIFNAGSKAFCGRQRKPCSNAGKMGIRNKSACEFFLRTEVRTYFATYDNITGYNDRI